MMGKYKRLKIVILGSYNSGKTTTLENICKKKMKIEYKGTTISLDYGNIIINNYKLHFFATPGQERFKFMREILSQGLDGAILVIDVSKGLTNNDRNIIEYLNSNHVSYVVFANKQDINCVDLYDDMIQAPIIPTIAVDDIGLKNGLDILLESMKKI